MTDADITALASRVVTTNGGAAAAAQRLLDGKTKPRRSLGRLEDLACQVAAIRGDATPPRPAKAIVVMGADHGVADEGVSAYPQEVTAADAAQLRARRRGHQRARAARGRARGRRRHGRRAAAAAPRRRSARGASAPARANFTLGPAMTRAQAARGARDGHRLADELARDGVGLIGIGEMGIANTTAASALAAVFTGAPPEDVTGRGTGVDDDDVAAQGRRRSGAALAINRPDRDRRRSTRWPRSAASRSPGSPAWCWARAAARVPVVVDGFIASVAALAAVRLAPHAAGYLIASHRSVEAGHRAGARRRSGAKPLLDLDLRLGEGTGAALAMPLVDAALAIAAEMATFASAGVSDNRS